MIDLQEAILGEKNRKDQDQEDKSHLHANSVQLPKQNTFSDLFYGTKFLSIIVHG
jgi:hypothetical protein